jgi:hypothetical protein
VYRPTALAEPFSRGRARRQRSTRSGRVVIRGSQVEDRSRLAATNAGEGLSYDALVVPSALEAIDAVGIQVQTARSRARLWARATHP